MSGVSRLLNIRFLDYWQAGSGQSAGGIVDAVAVKDAHGLPILPGRHIKGLLRQSVASAESWGWFADCSPENSVSVTEWLFGTDARSGSGVESPERGMVLPGMIRVSSAILPQGEHAWLSSKEGRHQVPHLYREIYTTAISLDSGAAKRHSLRGLEVSVPVCLQAQIDLQPVATHPLAALQSAWLASGNAWKVLEKSVSLIETMGAWRTRGLGRAELTWTETAVGSAHL